MKLAQIAATLFTVRDFCTNAADLERTAGKLSAIGYQSVQLSRLDTVPPEEVVAIMARHGLTICSTHEPSEDILAQPEKCVEKLRRLGCSLTAYPFPKGIDLKQPQAVRNLVERLDASGAVFRKAGMKLGYHNHDLEFAKMDGGTMLDFIYDQTHPENLVGELDTYWVRCGGGDCVAWCRKLRGRMPFIHLKDYSLNPDGTPMYCEIGRGQLPFRDIIAEAERSGCQWFIVEQDTCPGDPFVSLAVSLEYMRANLVS